MTFRFFGGVLDFYCKTIDFSGTDVSASILGPHAHSFVGNTEIVIRKHVGTKVSEPYLRALMMVQ